MTIKEIMSITGLSKQTIINKIKELYPVKIEHGKTTKLNQLESIAVVNQLKIEVSKNLTLESKNLTDQKSIIFTKDELTHFAKELVSEAIKQIQQQNKQIDKTESKTLNAFNKNQKLLLKLDASDLMDNFLYENFVIDFSRYDFFTSNQIFAYIYEAHFQTKLPAKFKKEFIKKYGLNSNGFKRNNENKVERGIQFLKIKI